MNSGQMLITVGAIILLSIVILRVNSGFLSTNTVMMENKYGVMAISLATSMLEDAVGEAFDEATADSTRAISTSELSSTLGPETGEIYNSPATPFDDFDDYNGLTINTAADSTLKSAEFDISCQVGYINAANPDVITGTRSWHKKITVTVSSKSMVDTIRLSTIYSYFYFR